MFYHFPRSSHYSFLPVFLESLGVNRLQEPVHRPQGIPIFQWFYCVKGRGEITIAGQKSIVSEGQGFLIAPNTAHAYSGLTHDFTLHFIGFSGNACAEILTSLHMCESGVYHISKPDLFSFHIRRLSRIVTGNKTEKETALSKACYDMFLDLPPCIRQIQDTFSASEDERIQFIIDFIDNHYAEPFSLSELAESIQLSREYMCTLFKQILGQTIVQYLQTVRITHARIFLIQYPEKQISEIASLCGFENSSYFGKVFRKICGCSPDQFRRKPGENNLA